jgi:hypothetical protein
MANFTDLGKIHCIGATNQSNQSQNWGAFDMDLSIIWL